MKAILPIKESMRFQDDWYKEAQEIQTLESLSEFLHHLMNDYKHDYGTICHAISAGAVATAVAMNCHSQGRITGYQASFIMWGFIQEWMHKRKKPLRLTDFDDMLYPQYYYRFHTISPETWEYLQKTAKRRLDESPTAHPRVREHWSSIVNGVVPFGYTVEGGY